MPPPASSPRPHRLFGDIRGSIASGGRMRPIGDKLVIATHNPGKLREIAALIEPLGIACVGAEELGLPEPDEIGNTFADNADLKAREAADLSGLPALALGRGRRRQPRLDAGDGEGLARSRGCRTRRRSGRSFHLLACNRLAERWPDGDVRRTRGRHGRLATPGRSAVASSAGSCRFSRSS